MAEEIKNEEQEIKTLDDDKLKEAIQDQLKKIQTQNLLLGAQSICRVILDKIYAFESLDGKKSTNDYKRCLKDLKQFCEIGISRKVKTDGTTELVEETTQN